MILQRFFRTRPAIQGSSLIMGLLLLASMSTTNAAVIVIQAPLDGGSAFYSNSYDGTINADDFSLGVASTLESIEWWGSYDPSGAASPMFNVSIFGDNAGSPDLSPLPFSPLSGIVTEQTTNLFDLNSNAVSHYILDLSSAPINLS